jgi:hypothetical protein
MATSDREFFDAIGRLKAASHRSALASHLQLSLRDRLRRSWELFERFRNDATAEPRTNDALAFFERARALGLYRPKA